MKINKSLLIVADLGLLRAYHVTQSGTDRQPHLKLIEELKPEGAHQKLSEQVTDQAGRFPRGGGSAHTPGDLSAGENLHAEAEKERQFIRNLAGRINTLLGDDEVTHCSIAISAAIHHQLLDAIAPESRAKIFQVLASNLAKTQPTKLQAHFKNALI